MIPGPAQQPFLELLAVGQGQSRSSVELGRLHAQGEPAPTQVLLSWQKAPAHAATPGGRPPERDQADAAAGASSALPALNLDPRCSLPSAQHPQDTSKSLPRNRPAALEKKLLKPKLSPGRGRRRKYLPLCYEKPRPRPAGAAHASVTCHLSPLTAPAPPPALGPAFCSGPFSPEMKLQRRPLGSWPDLANKSAGRTFKCEFKMNDGFFSTASSHAVFGSHFAVTELLVHRKSKFSRASPFYLGALPLQILIVLGSHLQVRADAVISRGPRSRRHHVPSLVNSERLMPGRSAVHVGRTQARKRGPAR